jgi:hypothetical protein
VEDDVILRDSEGKPSVEMLAYYYPQIDYEKKYCKKFSGKCYCFFDNLRGKIQPVLYFHKRTYYEKNMPEANEQCINCTMNCVREHEIEGHKKRTDEFIKQIWSDLLKELEKEVSGNCCDNVFGDRRIFKLPCQDSLSFSDYSG